MKLADIPFWFHNGCIAHEERGPPMASITVKNIPDDLYDRLKAIANTHHRSINSEVIHCLEIVLKPKVVTVEERLARVRSIREWANPEALGPEEIAQAIKQGRP